MPLALARLTVHGQVTTVSAEELSFTSSETREFFGRACAVTLSEELSAILDPVLNGWAAGLQVAATIVRKATEKSYSGGVAAPQRVIQSIVHGKAEELSDYLLEEIFLQQTAHLQRVLLWTGCLDLVCPSLYAAVMDTSEATIDTPADLQSDDGHRRSSIELDRLDESQAILDHLVREQLLLTPLVNLIRQIRSPYAHLGRRLPYPFREARHQHRRQLDSLHSTTSARLVSLSQPLFAEFLRNRLQRTDPAQFRKVQRSAADWHVQHGFVRSAIVHTLAAADLSFALQLVEQQAESTYQRGEFITLQYWLDALPPEMVRQRPLLSLLHAQVFMGSGRFPGGRSAFRRRNDRAWLEEAAGRQRAQRCADTHTGCQNSGSAIRPPLFSARA